jgi:hypothetical protein
VGDRIDRIIDSLSATPGRTIFSGRTRRSNSIGGRLHGFNLTVKRN